MPPLINRGFILRLTSQPKAEVRRIGCEVPHTPYQYLRIFILVLFNTECIKANKNIHIWIWEM